MEEIKQQILDLLRESNKALGRIEIMNKLGLNDKKIIKKALKMLIQEDKVGKLYGGTYGLKDNFLEDEDHIIVEIVKANFDEIFGFQVQEDDSEELLYKKEVLPVIISKQRQYKSRYNLKKGDYILARKTNNNLKREDKFIYIQKLKSPPKQSLAKVTFDEDGDICLVHLKRRSSATFVPTNDEQELQQMQLKEGDIVKIFTKHYNITGDVSPAEIVEKVPSINNVHELNLIGLTNYDIPIEFPQEVISEAQNLGAPKASGRVDMRNIPFVTIDGEDAKDFDDAVFAKKCEDNSCFWELYVAIADVAHYVKPNTNLDKEALKRGNSVYLPGTVVPMLPEVLSNGWCSLRPNEDRAALVCVMKIDKNGHMLNFEFKRAIINSAMRLTYKQVHMFLNSRVEFIKDESVKSSLLDLHSIWLLLDSIRQHRGALEIESNEKKIAIDENGNIEDIFIASRYESHQIIEECMILANVAAARFLEKNGLLKTNQIVYRVHDTPSAEKVNNLKYVLADFNIKPIITKNNNFRPQMFNSVLQQAKELHISNIISNAVLRSQSQAEYSTEQIGHFGLALDSYCHFTSPIRRYSDLLVHRAILSILEGGNILDQEHLEKICSHINETERRAVACERETVDRMIAKWLEPNVGSQFEAMITGMNNAGVFLELIDTGADVFCPMTKLTKDYFIFDKEKNKLCGRHTKHAYCFGDFVKVTLEEVSAESGSIIVSINSDPTHPYKEKASFDKQRRRHSSSSRTKSDRTKGDRTKGDRSKSNRTKGDRSKIDRSKSDRSNSSRKITKNSRHKK